MQDIHAGEHGNDFTGPPYVPVYVKLVVSFEHSVSIHTHTFAPTPRAQKFPVRDHSF